MSLLKNFKGKKEQVVIDENLGRQLKTAKKFSGLAVLGIVLAVGLYSSIYSVSEQEQAVITQFGKVVDVASAGLHFKIPLYSRV